MQHCSPFLHKLKTSCRYQSIEMPQIFHKGVRAHTYKVDSKPSRSIPCTPWSVATKKVNEINTHLSYNHNPQSDTHREHANLANMTCHIIVIVRRACRQRMPIHPIISIISMPLLHINLAISPHKIYSRENT